ncbi:MAG: hypothetical protein R6U54_05305 [Candidatus Omnitrophota bacterium]
MTFDESYLGLRTISAVPPPEFPKSRTEQHLKNSNKELKSRETKEAQDGNLGQENQILQGRNSKNY